MGPMVAGGSTMEIQPGPKRQMMSATQMNTSPAAMKPPRASG